MYDHIFVCVRDKRYNTYKCEININLKELYTSETTLASKIVLTPLNIEFIIKIRNSTSFMKSANIFAKKTQKGHF